MTVSAERIPVIIFIHVLLTLLEGLQCTNITTGNQSLLLKPPEIWLFAYNLEDSIEPVLSDYFRFNETFEDKVASRNGTDYVISASVEYFTIACEAEYPLLLTFPNKEQLWDIVSKTDMWPIFVVGDQISEFADDSIEPRSKLFRTYLMVDLLLSDFFSGTVSCQSVDNPKLLSEAHAYIFKHQVIENQGETIQVEVRASQKNTAQDVLLPCRPAEPGANVVLEKKAWRSKKWDRIPCPSKHVSFNPKIGFRIKTEYTGGYHPSNLYKCSIDASSDEFVLVNVTFIDEKVDKDVINLKSHSSLGSGARVEIVHARGNVGFRCCSGVNATPPVAVVETCNTVPTCELVKYRAKRRYHIERSKGLTDVEKLDTSAPNDCTGILEFPVHHCSVITACKGENIDFAQQYVKVYGESNDTDFGTWSNLSGTFKRDSKPISEAGNLKPEEKIMIFLLKPYVKDNMFPFMHGHFDIGNFFNPIPILYSTYATLESIDLTHYETKVYDMEPLIILCMASTYFYIGGGHIRVNWKNGSKSVIEREDMRSYFIFGDSSWNDLDRMLLNKMIRVVSRGVTAHVDMKSVDCYQPVWNSTKWDKMTYNLDIQPSIPPKLAGNKEEIMYVGLLETGYQITCEILEGTPPPRITFTKDGRVVNETGSLSDVNSTQIHTNNNSYNASRRLQFPPISLEMQGVYGCVAENVKGKATKVIRVIVEEKSSGIAILFALCVIGIMSTLLIAAGGLWYFLHRLKSQGTNNQQCS